jgi:poly(A) polymerase
MIESRVRQLVMKLEVVEHLLLAHPFIKGFDRKAVCYNDTEAMNCAHGTFPSNDTTKHPPPPESIEPGHPKTVYTTTFYIGLFIEPKESTDSFSCHGAPF